MRMISRIGFVAALAGALACTAAAGGRNWAAPEIRAVTQAGVLGTSPATFAPQSPLTQSALASAVKVADALQHPAAPPVSQTPLALTSTVGPGGVVAGLVTLELGVAGRPVDHVDFAVDGTGVHT